MQSALTSSNFHSHRLSHEQDSKTNSHISAACLLRETQAFHDEFHAIFPAQWNWQFHVYRSTTPQRVPCFWKFQLSSAEKKKKTQNVIPLYSSFEFVWEFLFFIRSWMMTISFFALSHPIYRNQRENPSWPINLIQALSLREKRGLQSHHLFTFATQHWMSVRLVLEKQASWTRTSAEWLQGELRKIYKHTCRNNNRHQ